jgi:hypothetical protein
MRKWVGLIIKWSSFLLLLISGGIWMRSYFAADQVVWRRQVSDLKYEDRAGAVSAGVLLLHRVTADYTVTAQPPAVLTGFAPPREFFVDQAKVEPGFEWSTHSPPGATASWSSRLSQLIRFENQVQDSPAESLRSPAIHHRYIVLPIWPTVLISMLLPARAAIGWRRRHRRKRQGLCVHCGYDLRVGSGVCPECGTAGRA